MSDSKGLDRTGLGAALVCYLMWGAFPLLFHQMSVRGASPLEIVGWRTVFAAPIAAALVLPTGRGMAFLRIVRAPKQLGMLTLSATLIGVNWTVYVWAVNTGQTLSASLGYYINPLVNAAVGAWVFREPISRAGRWALGLATVGVLVQAAALGAPPWIALMLATSFAGYGVVRKRVQADAQVGLLVECLLLAPFAMILLWTLLNHGGLKFGKSLDITALLLFCGPMTVATLSLFAIAARRLPLNIVGFVQFLTPTLQFVCGLLQGERLAWPSLVAFCFIWTGVAIFAFDLVRRLTRESAAGRVARAS